MVFGQFADAVKVAKSQSNESEKYIHINVSQ